MQSKKIPNLCLKDRTYRHTAVDLELRAFAEEEVGNGNLMEV